MPGSISTAFPSTPSRDPVKPKADTLSPFGNLKLLSQLASPPKEDRNCENKNSVCSTHD